MKKMEEKALNYIKKNKTAVDYVQSILISNSVILAILATDYITNITNEDMFIFVCSIVILFGAFLGVVANILICLKLSKKK
ncbi:MAG: hypothetical protein E7162_02005 [Firmicutes bacterium]|nr:hypothetical protein [Bacillota bacterium]